MSGSDPTAGPGDVPGEQRRDPPAEDPEGGAPDAAAGATADDPGAPQEKQGRGITVGRVALALVIALVVLVVLFMWVFPWIERNLSNPTLQALALLR